MVEDDELDIELVERILAQVEDLSFEVARSVEEAKQLIASPKSFDLALVDVLLPDGSGLDLIRALDPAPVAIISGYEPNEVRDRALERGAFEFIDKDEHFGRSLLELIALQLARPQGGEPPRVSLEAFAKAVTHELRNPATCVMSNAELLTDDLAPLAQIDENGRLPPLTRAQIDALREAPQLVEDIRQGMSQLMGVSRQLEMLAARAEPGSECDFATVLSTATSVTRGRIRRSAEFEVYIPTAPLTIRGASSRLGQVFINLLLNALFAIEQMGRPDRGRIRVVCDLLGDRVRTRIFDDGPGIPSNVLARSLFQPGVSLTRAQGGRGLGLSICAEIIAEAGGEIQLDDRANGRGAVATVLLPLATVR